MDRSAEKTLHLLREIADRREPSAEAACSASPTSALSTDRYLEIIEESLAVNEKLAVYEKVADDESAARELRMLLARRANWLRINARLPATGKIASGLKPEEIGDSERTQLMDEAAAEALLFSPVRMAGALRERANEACQTILKRSKHPVGLMASLKESVAQQRPKK